MHSQNENIVSSAYFRFVCAETEETEVVHVQERTVLLVDEWC